MLASFYFDIQLVWNMWSQWPGWLEQSSIDVFEKETH
jgi:hypothetical protein